MKRKAMSDREAHLLNKRIVMLNEYEQGLRTLFTGNFFKNLPTQSKRAVFRYALGKHLPSEMPAYEAADIDSRLFWLNRLARRLDENTLASAKGVYADAA